MGAVDLRPAVAEEGELWCVRIGGRLHRLVAGRQHEPCGAAGGRAGGGGLAAAGRVRRRRGLAPWWQPLPVLQPGTANRAAPPIRNPSFHPSPRRTAALHPLTRMAHGDVDGATGDALLVVAHAGVVEHGAGALVDMVVALPGHIHAKVHEHSLKDTAHLGRDALGGGL